MSSLTRKLKRKFERDTRRREMKDLYAHVDRVSLKTEAKLRREYQEARIMEDAKNMTIAMYYLFGVGLHEIYGFSALRLSRIFEWVDDELGKWRRGEIRVEDLQKKLYADTGIDLQI